MKCQLLGVETDFNYQVHIYLCHRNREYDTINGKGHFEKLALISAKDGMIPCPIGVNPHWEYDWEEYSPQPIQPETKDELQTAVDE